MKNKQIKKSENLYCHCEHHKCYHEKGTGKCHNVSHNWLCDCQLFVEEKPLKANKKNNEKNTVSFILLSLGSVIFIISAIVLVKGNTDLGFTGIFASLIVFFAGWLSK